MFHVEHDDEFKAREARARDILHRVKSALRATASARAINHAAPLQRTHYTRGAGEAKPRQDWIASVYAALRGAGVSGAAILVHRLCPQQKSQSCSYRTIALKMRLSESDVVFMYHAALTFFLNELDQRGIPDDYRAETDMPPVTYRRPSHAA